MYAIILRVIDAIPPAQEALHLDACADWAPTSLPSDRTRSLLDLNSATQAELMALPGIGKKLANAIIDFRAQIGAFHYPEELMLINGISEGKLDAIYDLVYVRTVDN